MPKFPRFALIGLSGLLFAVTISVGLYGQAKQESPKPGAETAPLPAPKNAEGVGAAVDPNKYVLGPEDVIFIKTWREADFTFQAGVRPDGKITVPLVGEVDAAGLTPQQLTNSLKEKLSKYINTPDVTVIVQEVRSKKYYMDGEWVRPGAYALVTPTTVLEAISISGGFKEFGDRKHVRILRKTESKLFNYNEVIKGKKLEQNIYLENGDHVIAK